MPAQGATKLIDAPSEGEELFRSMFEAAPVGTFLTRADGRFVLLNPAFLKMLGYSEAECSGLSMAFVSHPEYRDPNMEALNRLFGGEAEGDRISLEICLLHRDGHAVWGAQSTALIRDQLGNPLYVVGVVEEITHRKQMEKALKASIQQQTGILNNIPAIAWLKDQQGRFLAVNEPFAKACGVQPEDLVGKTDFDAWDEELARAYRADDQEIIQTAKRKCVEEPLVDNAGNRSWIETVKTPIFNERSQVIGTAGIARDITARKQAEESVNAHLKAVDAMERINRLIRKASDLDQMLSEVLAELLDIFSCDRAWLLYPCDPQAQVCRVPMERTRPGWPGALAQGMEMDVNAEFAAVFDRALKSEGPLCQDASTGWVVPEFSVREFYVQAQMLKVLYPKVDKPWLLGIHHCEHPHVFTEEELGLLDEIGRRVADSLSSLLTLRNLGESEKKYRQLFETMAQGVIYQDADGRINSANPAAERILGLSLNQMQGLTSLAPHCKTVHEDGSDYPGDTHPTMMALKTGKPVSNAIMGIFHPDAGHHSWIIINAIPQFRSGADKPFQVYATFTDITERKRAERALFEEKERAQVTLHSIGEGVISTDAEGSIEYLNPVAESLTGWSIDEARGRPLEQVFHVINEQTRELVENPVDQPLEEAKSTDLVNQTTLISRAGQEYAIQYSAAPIRGKEGDILGRVLVLSDVTEERRLSQEISYQASHDPLTGLLNRREFERRLERSLETARIEGGEYALCYLDLDQFKLVNDTCGHVAGDELLRQLSQMLQTHVRQRDTLARLGGDEFGLIMDGCSVLNAAQVAQNIINAVTDFRFFWEDKSFNIGVSIGLVPITRGSGEITELLSAADTACYMAKEQGRSRVHVHHEDDEDLARRHGEMQWAARLPWALEKDRFLLYLQPIVAATGSDPEAEHYELLLRLEDETGEMVSPGIFLPAAERYNLCSKIDRWVIGAAFRWLSENPARLERLYLCSINLSGLSLGDEAFLGYLIQQFEDWSIPPEKICFEVTETAAIANLSRATAFIKDLKDLGCSFALDDFGSGLSSFAYLKNLPVDFLKIDGLFVKNILDDPMDLAMVKAINDIGQVMGKQTIAEFVENEAIRNKLKEIGVNFMQGYGIGRPRPTG